MADPAHSSGPRVLYICSAARCGSTVTDMFLGGHSRIASLGEANFLGKAIRLRQPCTCGVPVCECPAWGRVFERLAAGGAGVDLRQDPYGWPLWNARSLVNVDRARQTLGFHLRFRFQKAALVMRAKLPATLQHRVPLSAELRAAIDNKLTLYDAVAAAWDKDVVVDSSKNPFEALELVRRCPDRACIVLLSRDGRGVYLSRRRSGVRQRSAVDDWARYYQRALSVLTRQVPPANLIRLAYERLAAEPARVGAELCARVGLDYEPAMERLDQAVRHMVDGNDTRFSGRADIRLDERWRHELSADDLAYFMRRGGSVNGALGYA